jgi:uncharacterized tellurite resistance protein B-like protein
MAEKVNPVEELKKAVKAYSAIEELFQSVGKSFEEDVDESFKVPVFLRQMDYTIQLVLFKVVIADGEADKAEMLAIKSIPQHGDILDLLNEHLSQHISWDDIVGDKMVNLVRISHALDSVSDDIIDNFMDAIAFVDNGVGDEKLFLSFASSVDDIAEGVAGVNGEIEGSERLTTYQAIIEVLRRKYDKAVEGIAKMKKSAGGKA